MRLISDRGRELLPHLRRIVPWPTVVGAVSAAALLGATAKRPGAIHWTVVVLAAAVTLSSVLDDPADAVLASSPTPRGVRWALRLVVALAAAAATAAVALLLIGRRAGLGTGDAVLELAAVSGVAVVTAAFVLRRTPAAPAGVVAGPLVLAMAAIALGLPGRFAVYPVGAHRWLWAAAIAVSCAALPVLALDPAARPFRREPGTAPPAHPGAGVRRR